MSKFKVVIGACTCRSASGLRKLLSELSGHRSVHETRIVIVDNDAKEEGRAVCREFQNLGMKIDYRVEPTPGIPFARNTLVKAALAHEPDYVLMIDDDEYPLAGWVDNMVAAAVEAGADVAGGPVFPTFETPPESPLLPDDYAKPLPVPATGLDTIGSTANILFSGRLLRSWADVMFDARFALSGGSDTHFLRRTRRAGYRHVFAPAAVVVEEVPANRLSETWVLTRNYRHGSIRARIEIYRLGVIPAFLTVSPAAVALLLRSLFRTARRGGTDARARHLARRDRARARGIMDAFRGKVFNEYSSDHYRT